MAKGFNKPSDDDSRLVYSDERLHLVKTMLQKGHSPLHIVRLITRGVPDDEEVRKLAEAWAPLLKLTTDQFMRAAQPGRHGRRKRRG